MIQQQVAKVKGIADVIFCIDFSGSMSPCIEGVKEHVSTFVKSLETSSPNVKIDWRIGLCAYSDDTFLVKDFVTDAGEFAVALGSLDTMGDEFTPGAIDYCISHYKWRPASNRFLVVFTDEVMEGGYSPPEVVSGYPRLLQKIADFRIRLFFFGPRCPYYTQLEKVPRCSVTYLEDQDFSGVDFSSLLSSLGKTVSLSCSQNESGTSSRPYDVFDLNRVNVMPI